MPTICIPLSIPTNELLRWYSGGAKDVKAVSVDGRSVRFPADVIRPYVTHEGVFGYFEIRFSASGKFENIRRVQ